MPKIEIKGSKKYIEYLSKHLKKEHPSTKKRMKIKDIHKDTLLQGTKVKIPKKFQDSYIGISKEMYLYSFWNKGIWLKKSMKDTKIFPLCINPEEVLNFDVLGGKKWKLETG